MLYRAYVVSEEGHFISVRELEADTDAEAIRLARRFIDGHDVEVWYRGQFLARLKHKSE
jgi:hypothetical protein